MPDPIPPAPEPADDKPKRDAQNKKITNYANQAAVFMATLLDDDGLKTVAHDHGYTDAELALGQGYVTALGGGLQKRQRGLGTRENEQNELDTTEETVRNAYAAFREIARASFPAPGDQTALALSGPVREDLDRFVTQATTSYTNAGRAPYVEKMTLRNYAPARLATLLQQVKDLTADEASRDTAGGNSIDDTKARDAAYDLLRAWLKELKGVMRGALRGQPGQLAKLKL